MSLLVVGPNSYIAERLSQRMREEGRVFYLASMRKDLETEYVKGEYIGKADELDLELMNEKEIDTVLISTALSARDAQIAPEKAEELSCVRLPKLIKTLVGSGVRRVLYLSSIKVYGENPQGKIDELSPTLPTSIYAKIHLRTETILKEIGSKEDIEVMCLRLSNVFGAPLRSNHSGWDLAANDFARQYVLSRKIESKTPEIVRNILPMNMLLDVILGGINGELGRINSGTLNVGSGLCLSMGSLKDLIKEVSKAVRRGGSSLSVLELIRNTRTDGSFTYGRGLLGVEYKDIISDEMELIASEFYDLVMQADRQFGRD